MTTLFNRWLPGVTLLAWSSVLLAFYFTGRVASFLHPTFRPCVLLAGLVMLAMGCCFLFLPGVASCCDDERCGHPLGRRKTGRILTFLILLAPHRLRRHVFAESIWRGHHPESRHRHRCRGPRRPLHPRPAARCYSRGLRIIPPSRPSPPRTAPSPLPLLPRLPPRLRRMISCPRPRMATWPCR